MKTPDEIKKGLECLLGMCEGVDCDECSRNVYEAYEIIRDDHIKDALALIRQLEAELEAVKRERDAATRKMILRKVEHNATLYRCGTCPSCGNVVSEYEKWGETFVRIENKYCHFCGQHLDWDGFSEQPPNEEAK